MSVCWDVFYLKWSKLSVRVRLNECPFIGTQFVWEIREKSWFPKIYPLKGIAHLSKMFARSELYCIYALLKFAWRINFFFHFTLKIARVLKILISKSHFVTLTLQTQKFIFIIGPEVSEIKKSKQSGYPTPLQVLKNNFELIPKVAWNQITH